MSEPDVVVVGGSLVGLTTAARLAEQGVAVLLLEAGRFDDAHGLGSIELSVVEHPHRTVAALGERFEQLQAFTHANKRAAGELFDRCGVTWWGDAREAPALEASLQALQRRGVRAEVVPGEGAFELGLHLPDDGMLVEHARQTLIDRARAAGAELREDHPARLTDDDRVHSREERFEPELIVLAAGAGCAELDGRLKGAVLGVRDTAISVPGSSTGFHRSGQGWVSWRQEGAELTVSGARWATPHLEVGEETPVADPRVVARLGDQLARRGLPREGRVRSWITAQSRDQLPLVGPLPGQPRRIVATGFGTNPATWSFAAADAVVRGILQGDRDLPRLLSSSRLVHWRLG